MLSSITHPPEEKYDLVAGLIQLFDEVDINGSYNFYFINIRGWKIRVVRIYTLYY